MTGQQELSNPGWMRVMLPGPTLERRNFSKPCLLHPGSFQKWQDTHTQKARCSHCGPRGLQPAWMKLGIAMFAAAEAAISSPAPPIPAGDLPRHIYMRSPHPSIAQTSRKYLESKLGALNGICWDGDEPAGVKYQFKDKKVLLETSRSEGKKVNTS